MISVTELRNGTKVEMDGGLWECLDYQHLKMGRGGAKVVTKFRNLESGAIVERTFNASEKLQDIFIDYRKMQFLYSDGDTYTFMDTETYEQPTLTAEQIGSSAKFLKESMEVTVDYYGDKPLKVTLPNVVELTITQTDPGVKGDTVSGGSKPAVLETGATVAVPLFIDQGETVRIDTRTGEYLGRA
ncbi:elongation factor P [Truepera radiovictrix]|uniref:Elongation factor P n=1 Tax=Truepera radiovictrix (strain DSM 17093 / CIP 108686 / LMG 22925 / RQ-24) TaxID=649638 RepID=D7CVX8_TRURR|nr:elongation factor P [Truepera radiovictrix]ADI14241.1 translation elongation factor P [Truepera radiovictrix DSM 17093]WMT57202.1 elongation factor P [Truepera radiovictrix]